MKFRKSASIACSASIIFSTMGSYSTNAESLSEICKKWESLLKKHGINIKFSNVTIPSNVEEKEDKKNKETKNSIIVEIEPNKIDISKIDSFAKLRDSLYSKLVKKFNQITSSNKYSFVIEEDGLLDKYFYKDSVTNLESLLKLNKIFDTLEQLLKGNIKEKLQESSNNKQSDETTKNECDIFLDEDFIELFKKTSETIKENLQTAIEKGGATNDYCNNSIIYQLVKKDEPFKTIQEKAEKCYNSIKIDENMADRLKKTVENIDAFFNSDPSQIDLNQMDFQFSFFKSEKEDKKKHSQENKKNDKIDTSTAIVTIKSDEENREESDDNKNNVINRLVKLNKNINNINQKNANFFRNIEKISDMDKQEIYSENKRAKIYRFLSNIYGSTERNLQNLYFMLDNCKLKDSDGKTVYFEKEKKGKKSTKINLDNIASIIKNFKDLKKVNTIDIYEINLDEDKLKKIDPINLFLSSCRMTNFNQEDLKEKSILQTINSIIDYIKEMKKYIDANNITSIALNGNNIESNVNSTALVVYNGNSIKSEPNYTEEYYEKLKADIESALKNKNQINILVKISELLNNEFEHFIDMAISTTKYAVEKKISDLPMKKNKLKKKYFFLQIIRINKILAELKHTTVSADVIKKWKNEYRKIKDIDYQDLLSQSNALENEIDKTEKELEKINKELPNIKNAISKIKKSTIFLTNFDFWFNKSLAFASAIDDSKDSDNSMMKFSRTLQIATTAFTDLLKAVDRDYKPCEILSFKHREKLLDK